MSINKNYLKTHIVYNARGDEDNGNLLINKPSTTLMQNCYTTRDIRLFKQLP